MARQIVFTPKAAKPPPAYSQAVKAAGQTLHIQVLGLAVIAADVSPELARNTIASIHVLGSLQASPAVKAALGDRIR